MNLFEIVNYQVTFSPQALVLAPFKEVWDNDPSEDKYQAVKELSYIYYMCDDRSDYMYILDPDERRDTVIDVLQMENWIEGSYIQKAMDFYKRYSETTSTKLLRSTRGVIQKISGFLDVVDPNERDLRTNKPVFDINKITAAVEKVPKLVKALNEIEKEVIAEKELKAQTGNRDMGLFEDEGM